MRLSAKNVYGRVTTMPDADRQPVRMQLGANVYRLDVDEAIQLATHIVQAVDQVKTQEGTQE